MKKNIKDIFKIILFEKQKDVEQYKMFLAPHLFSLHSKEIK